MAWGEFKIVKTILGNRFDFESILISHPQGG